MSNESFDAFMAKVKEDAALRDKLRAAGGDDGLSVQALAEFASGLPKSVPMKRSFDTSGALMRM